MTTRARRKREKEKRRQSILKAAHDVFFEQGFGATVDDVAERAEVSKGTVYLYFESKETILALLLLRGLRELVSTLERAYTAQETIPTEERLRRLSQAYLQFFEVEPTYFRLLMATDRGKFRESIEPEVYERVLAVSGEGLEWVVQTVQQGIDDGIFVCEDARVAASILWATMNGVLQLMDHPLRREMVGVKREALCQAALETVIRGLRISSDN